MLQQRYFSYSPGISSSALLCRLPSVHGQVPMAVVSSGKTWWDMDCLTRRGLPIFYFFSFKSRISFHKELGKKKPSNKNSVFDQAKGKDKICWQLEMEGLISEKLFKKTSSPKPNSGFSDPNQNDSVLTSSFLFNPPIILINCILEKEISFYRSKYYLCSLKFLKSPWLQMCKRF